MDDTIRKRSVVVAGHRTSVSLQSAFWTELKAIAAERRQSINELVESVDNGRAGNLSRALRLSHHLFETPVDPWLAWEPRRGDIFYLGRILARNARGEESRRILRFAFRVRARLRG